MAFKFKKSIFGFIDMLKTKNISKKRKKLLAKGSTDELPASDPTQDLARNLHHGFKEFKITEIIPFSEELKTFRFTPLDGKLAFFKPGQYISVQIDADGILVNRPYSLSLSPKRAHDKCYYEVTIKKVEKGIFTTWMFTKAKVGSIVKINAPEGDFAYNPIRDQKHIVALAGGSGITPFASMAEAIVDGTLKNVKLSLFHGFPSMEYGVWVKELKELATKSDNFEYVPVVEKQDPSIKETGFISKDLVDKYVKDEYTIFACGSYGFYNFIMKGFKNLNPKNFRLEKSIVGWRKVPNLKKFKIRVHIRDQVFDITCLNTQTVLQALEENHIDAANKCRVGNCGYCHAKCISGKYRMLFKTLRNDDEDFNYFPPCCSYPETDLEIIINPNK